VGTPGRVLDIFNRNRLLILKELEVLVLDEADTLLDMGFRQSINQVSCLLLLRFGRFLTGQ
jgi:superfamily II DNA/RNA helicase